MQGGVTDGRCADTADEAAKMKRRGEEDGEQEKGMEGGEEGQRRAGERGERSWKEGEASRKGEEGEDKSREGIENESERVIARTRWRAWPTWRMQHSPHPLLRTRSLPPAALSPPNPPRGGGGRCSGTSPTPEWPLTAAQAAAPLQQRRGATLSGIRP